MMQVLLRCLLLTLLVGATTALATEIALVTAREGAIRQIERNDAEQLYLGRLSALPNGTPVRLHDLPPGPIRNAFYQHLIRKNALQTRAHWSRMVFTGRARPPVETSGHEAMIGAILADPNAIGYLPAEFVPDSLRTLLVVGEDLTR